MHFNFSLLWTGILATVCVDAVPSAKYVQHEKRDILPSGWQRVGRLPGEKILPLRIALTQANLHKGYDYLMDVSHPESSNYGKHWSAKQVAEAFSPSRETVDAVTSWLTGFGVAPERISRSQSLGWLQLNATVEEAERLLKTEYHLHQHESTGKPHVACDKYHLPEHLKEHIDFVTPTVHFDAKVPVKEHQKRATPSTNEPEVTAALGVPVKTKAALSITNPNNGFQPKKGADIDIFTIIDELESCNQHITPNCLRALYEFPPGLTANPKNSYGIVEYSPNNFLQNDLNLFFANFSKLQVHKTPTTDLIDGAQIQTSAQGFAYNGESDLDLEYAMALINPQKVTLYQTGDEVEGASFNNFLDAIDKSYCTYEGGDDPSQDASYPDSAPGGYNGPENCGGFGATKVISTSYGYNEVDLTPAYEARQCNEYMKLGLQGVSFFYSSGDFGVAGNGGACIGPGGVLNGGGSGAFNPSFPGACPYITSVGATQITPGASVTSPEQACETVIYSGGGFSNVFPLPSYQASAVATYFSQSPPPYTSAQFNNSKKARGYPDISANGANYITAIDGGFSLVYGTSASSPTVGSIFTLINEARLALGKSSVGFVNPMLYAHPGALNDITKGSNPGCGTNGFSAVKGWDPVTGLGTPNYPKLLAAFLGLP